jgi:ribosomal protein S12 methylthiotransferase accessory factor YcaO
MPHRDSSGCALHRTAEASRQSALREFAERQSLLAAWIASRSEAEIIADGADFPEGSLAGHLFSKLKESGEVRLLFLSRMFAGYCVFAFFVANTEHCEARFACASAFDIRSDAAVGKALAELWHCWIATPMKLQTAASEPQALNHLERNFLSYNDLEAASRLRFCADRGEPEMSVVPLHEFIRYPSVTVAELEQSVCRISENIFWYNYPVIFGANVFVASKIVSPDFFLHIDTSRRLNFSNRFAVFAGLDYSRFDYSPTCLP